MMKINIPAEFSRVSGTRYKVEGDQYGELFRETLLGPRFGQAQSEGTKLIIELDGVMFGYPASFLEESFGGLARIVGIEKVLEGISFVSTHEPLLVDEIHGYIRD